MTNSALAAAQRAEGQLDLDRLRRIAGSVPDPEIPVLTLDDLGILRGVDIAADGTVLVTLTPTYTGCPAIAAIAADVETALRAAGARRVSVRTVLSPAWTTDWMSSDAHRKLRDYGIAPPGACVPPADGRPRGAGVDHGALPASVGVSSAFRVQSPMINTEERPPQAADRRPSAATGRRPVGVTLSARCPRCGSLRTREISRFGSTPCKSLWSCRSCAEPFDSFKSI